MSATRFEENQELRCDRKTLFGATVGLAVLGTCCFYDIPALGFLSGVFLVVCFLLVQPRDISAYRNVWLWGVATLVMVPALVFDPDPAALVMAIFFLAMFRVGLSNSFAHSLRDKLVAVAAWPLSFLHDGWSWGFVRDNLKKDAGRRWMRNVALWVAPIGLTLIFIAFFCAANPIVEQWLDGGMRLLEKIRLPNFGQIFFALLLYLFFSALFRMYAAKNVTASVLTAIRKEVQIEFTPIKSDFLPASLLRALILFNGIFLIQNLLDVEYLWAGASLPEGMTYAAYAHRGAYPLIVTALLAGLITLLVFANRDPEREQRWVWPRRLAILWLAQNIFLVVSALLRLEKYISIYALTRWRVAAAVWMVLVAIGLGVLIVRVWRDKDSKWVFKRCFFALFAVLTLLCFFDIRGFIAAYNFRNCREILIREQAQPTSSRSLSANIDLAYMIDLGTPALPILVQLQAAGLTDSVDDGRIARLHRELEQDQSSILSWSVLRAWTVRKLQEK